jgi:hypothetical protein
MKIIKLTESDLNRIVNKIIKETEEDDKFLDDEIENMDPSEKIKYSEELASLKQAREKLAQLRKDYSKELEIIEYFKNLKDDLDKRQNPKVYLGLGKHHTSKEPFIIGRSVWKKGVNDYAHLSAYVGPLTKFNGDKNSPEAMKIAVEKIKNKINTDFPRPEKINPEIMEFLKNNIGLWEYIKNDILS